MKNKKPQYAQIEHEFGFDPPRVYCPICGTLCNDEVQCEHLAFIHISAIGDYIYKSDDYSARIGEIEEQEEIIEDVVTFLQKAGYDNKMIILENTYGGMACGPLWLSDIFGFDYSKIKNH